MEENKKKRKHRHPEDHPGISPIMLAAHTIQNEGRGIIKSDVQGSYTGTPDGFDIPEQDADDL